MTSNAATFLSWAVRLAGALGAQLEPQGEAAGAQTPGTNGGITEQQSWVRAGGVGLRTSFGASSDSMQRSMQPRRRRLHAIRRGRTSAAADSTGTATTTTTSSSSSSSAQGSQDGPPGLMEDTDTCSTPGSSGPSHARHAAADPTPSPTSDRDPSPEESPAEAARRHRLSSPCFSVSVSAPAGWPARVRMSDGLCCRLGNAAPAPPPTCLPLHTCLPCKHARRSASCGWTRSCHTWPSCWCCSC